MIKLIKLVFKIIGSLFVVGLLVVILAAFDFGGVSDLAKTIKADVLTWVDTDAAAKEIAAKFIDLQEEALQKLHDIDTTQAEEILANINIKDWDIVDTPEGLTEDTHLGGTALGFSLKMVFYTDPSYISIIIGDSTTTFAVPTSAQPYVQKLHN